MCLLRTLDIVQSLSCVVKGNDIFICCYQYKTSPMRVSGLDAQTHATSIDGMAAIESHLRVSDEYLISCTIFCLLLSKKCRNCLCDNCG
jgi:hypothetical protein